MKEAKTQHLHTQNQLAHREGRGASLEALQGEQIAQLEAMIARWNRFGGRCRV